MSGSFAKNDLNTKCVNPQFSTESRMYTGCQPSIFHRIKNVHRMSTLNFPQNQECTQDVQLTEEIGPLRPHIGCFMLTGHFPPKSPIIRVSLAERDSRLKASYTFRRSEKNPQDASPPINNMTYSYVRHDSFICATWLIHMCDMTHSYVWHDSFICVTWDRKRIHRMHRLPLIFAEYKMYQFSQNAECINFHMIQKGSIFKEHRMYTEYINFQRIQNVQRTYQFSYNIESIGFHKNKNVLPTINFHMMHRLQSNFTEYRM